MSRSLHAAAQLCQQMHRDCVTRRCTAQAGTYIKEFVHGDGGRTVPSLASLAGCSEAAEVLALDVMQVHMDFL